MAGNSTKLGPQPPRAGTTIYPGFSNTVPPGYGRIQRLEKGSQRYQRAALRPSSGTYSRLPSNILHTNVNGNQVLDVSKVYVRKIGGVSVQGNTSGFAYVATSTTITIYWDGTNGSIVPVITRADGSRFTVPTSGSPMVITGLLAVTTYYFLPFWNINNLCNIGWVQGTAGTPQIAFVAADVNNAVTSPQYLMQQTLQQNEPLTNGYMSITTTNGAPSGGNPGGGGKPGSGCVMSGTDIQAVGDLPYKLEVLSETEWIHLKIEDGRELYCTYDHPLYHAVSGKIRAEHLVRGDLVITDRGEQRVILTAKHRRVCSKHKVIMETGHLFWANGFLSHNSKAQNPGTGP